ncbi:DNA repair exonuclease [Bdellovibrionota bacterium FG-1]
MIRILHTADWQMGLRASHVARVSDRVRQARLNAAQKVVKKANDERVDALILAGDIFEDNHVENGLVYDTVRILSTSQVPVYVLPGNHDPLSQDSVYRRNAWREKPAHVHLLETHDFVEIAGGQALLLPAPLTLKKSELDPLQSLQLPENGASGIWIGVAHGSLKIEGKYGRDDFPIALDSAERLGLSYLALGHWHGRYIHGDRTAYSGTFETTKFGESNSGLALMVEITAGAPRITEFRSGDLIWLSHELNLGHLEKVTELEVARLRQELIYYTEVRQSVLLRVRTTGECTPDSQILLRRLEEEWNSQFLYFELERKDLSSNEIQGRIQEVASKNPFIASLLESLWNPSSSMTQETEQLEAARRMLTELLVEP